MSADCAAIILGVILVAFVLVCALVLFGWIVLKDFLNWGLGPHAVRSGDFGFGCFLFMCSTAVIGITVLAFIVLANEYVTCGCGGS